MKKEACHTSNSSIPFERDLSLCKKSTVTSFVPKIANLRNHQGADTDASARGFIYKLEFGSKYTRHSGAKTWTPKWVTAGFLWAGLGDFQKGGGISQVLFTF